MNWVNVIVSKVELTSRNCKMFMTDIVQKLVFKDEEGNIISETNSSFYYVDCIVISDG